MKKFLKINLFLAAVCVFAMAAFTACEGPAGAPGNDGKDGKDGTNGTNGLNAAESCKKCHNSSSDLLAKSKQLNHSLHVSGHAWMEGTRNSCAPCHSHEGFLDVIAKNPPKNKYNASAATLTDPSSFGCRTCHKIHTAYDSTDYKFTTTAAIDMLIDTTKTLTLDFGPGSSSNLCAKCHQPRIIKQMDYNGAPTGSYTAMTSYRWGTHYGTQGAIAGGKGGFEITGATAYTNSAHKAGASCVSCHAAATVGTSGGHTFSVVNEETGLMNKNGCAKCHTNATTLSTLISTTQTEIDNLAIQLGDKLGFMEKDVDGVYTGYVDLYDPSANPDGKFKFPGSTSSWTQAQKDVNTALPALPAMTNIKAAAAGNFQLVVRDGSHGIHNAPYAKALLSNSIAALP